MNLYHDFILDHYRNPRNSGSLENATHQADVKNPTCGDTLHMDIRVNRGNISDIRFTGSGCAISQASASILSEYIRGKSLAEALALDIPTVLGLLGVTLSPGRLKCGLLSLEVLKRSLNDKNERSAT
jgi:nitrogen fixation NifU-like protein